MSTLTNRRQILTAAAAMGAAAATTPTRAEEMAVDRYIAPPRRPLAGPVRLIANENPYGPAPSARNAMLKGFDESHRYAIQSRTELAKLIAEAENVPPDHVTVASGSGEILTAAGLIYGRDGQTIVTGAPTFDILQRYAAKMGGIIDAVPLDAEFKFDLPAIEARVKDGVGLVYICNPNNPTGTLLGAGTLRDFCRRVSEKATVFVDEAYMEITDDPVGNSMIDLVRDGGNVVVARTFSKVHGMAGLRIGYGLARPDIAKRLDEFRMSMPSSLGLIAAIASIQDKEFQAYSKSKILEGRQLLYDVCDELGIAYVQSHANFVFLDTGMKSADVMPKMKAENLLVRPVPEYDGHIRVSMGTVEEMQYFQEAVRRIYAA